jgi:ACS family sodium-dependent inorganic phosphate cotransporter
MHSDPLQPSRLSATAGARSPAAGVLFTTLTLACCGFSRGGFSVNHMDIAPRYAGVVMCVAPSSLVASGLLPVVGSLVPTMCA